MKWGRAVVWVVLFTLLCGCTASGRGREPEDTVLAEVLGFDRRGTAWVLTAAGRDEAGERVIQTVEGESLAETFAAMPCAGAKWFSLANATQILLGDGVEPEEVLWFLLTESGMSWRASVWYVPIAEAVMNEMEDGGAARLAILEETASDVVTVLDALEGLFSEEAAQIPVLMVHEGQVETVGAICFERVEGE